MSQGGGRAWLAVVRRRLVQALGALLGATVVIWGLVPLAPGDPAERVLTARGALNPTPSEIEAVRGDLGLDRPLIVQYGAWLGRAVQGDLSTSYLSKSAVSSEITRRLPATALLAGVALALSVALALPAGLVAAAFAGRWPDSLLRVSSVLGSSVPSFLVGLVLLQWVVLRLGWGRVLADGRPGQVWLPAVCLAIGEFALLARLLRNALLEALAERYTLVAASRGATRLRVLLRHALPNTAVLMLAAVGVTVGSLLGGSAVVEAVFTWPGIGSYAVDAVKALDLPVIQGVVLLATVTFVATSVLADLAGRVVDPRAR